MKKLTVTLAALGLMLTVACTKKDDAKAPSAVSVNEKEQLLNATFKPMDATYEASNHQLADTVLSVRGGSSKSSDKKYDIFSPETTLRFEGMIRGLESDITFEPVVIDTKIRNGEMFAIEIANHDQVNQMMKGRLYAKGKCLDFNCDRVALLLQYQSGPRSNPWLSAGYILSNNKEVFGIETSVGSAIEWSKADAYRKALNREEEVAPEVKKQETEKQAIIPAEEQPPF